MRKHYDRTFISHYDLGFLGFCNIRTLRGSLIDECKHPEQKTRSYESRREPAAAKNLLVVFASRVWERPRSSVSTYQAYSIIDQFLNL
jgi:hypothetical protein